MVQVCARHGDDDDDNSINGATHGSSWKAKIATPVFHVAGVACLRLETYTMVR